MTADRACVPVAQIVKKKEIQYTFKFFHSLGKICEKLYAVLLQKWVMLRFRVFWGDTYGFYLIFKKLLLKKKLMTKKLPL